MMWIEIKRDKFGNVLHMPAGVENFLIGCWTNSEYMNPPYDWDFVFGRAYLFKSETETYFIGGPVSSNMATHYCVVTPPERK